MTLYFNYIDTSYAKYGYLNLILCFNIINVIDFKFV